MIRCTAQEQRPRLQQLVDGDVLRLSGSEGGGGRREESCLQSRVGGHRWLQDGGIHVPRLVRAGWAESL